MDRQHKVWGERWIVRKDDIHAISYLKLRKGYQCSWHKHQTKYNLFVVLSGRVAIITEELGKVKRRIELTEGQCFTTRPGEMHQFVALEDSGILEEMYVQYCEDDIQRQELGGRVKKEEAMRKPLKERSVAHAGS